MDPFIKEQDMQSTRYELLISLVSHAAEVTLLNIILSQAF